MKMKKRCGWLLVILALVTAAVFSGCGGKKKITAEELMDEVTANTEGMESARINLVVDISMGIKQSGISMDLDMDMDLDMETTMDPAAAHITGNLSMNLMNISMEMESYSVEENGKIVTYSGMGGEWAREEQPATEMDREGINAMIANGTSYELQDKTEKIDGKEVYVLNGKVSGKYMEELMGGMSDSMSGVPIDWAKLVMDVVVKIDTKTKLPVEASIDCGAALSELMKGAMAAAGGEDVEISVKEFVMTCTYEGFNDVDEIVVPESVKAAAQDMGGSPDPLDDFLNNSQPESDLPTAPSSGGVRAQEESLAPNEDGTYRLANFWGNEGEVNIATPSGYEISPYSDSQCLVFYDTLNRPNDSISIFYMLDDDYTEEEMEEYYMMDVEGYQKDQDYSNLEVQEKKTVQVDGREASYLRFAYVYDEDASYVEYHVWMFLEDGSVVQCDIEESSYDGACDILDDGIVETVISAIQK